MEWVNSFSANAAITLTHYTLKLAGVNSFPRYALVATRPDRAEDNSKWSSIQYSFKSRLNIAKISKILTSKRHLPSHEKTLADTQVRINQAELNINLHNKKMQHTFSQ